MGCVAYGLLIEPKQLKIRQFEFVSEKYNGPPLRIGVMTDIHIGGMHVPAHRVETLVKEMNVLGPDIVLLPGDFVNGHLPFEEHDDEFNKTVEMGIAFLAGLKAPAFATIGNHDEWYDAALTRGMLEAASVSVLNNRSQTLADICLVGLADYDTSAPDRQAFSTCPADKPPLIFTHSPQAWQYFRRDSLLAIAGHTHGGQVNLPIIGRRVNATKLGAQHSYGFSKLGEVDVFVSAGIGTSILPVRFRSPPEIVLITIQPRP